MVLSKFTYTRHGYLQDPDATELHTMDVWIPGLTGEAPLGKKWVV